MAMRRIGDDVGGWCPKCKLNMFMTVSATDGREIFTVTCRTCHNTVKYQKERSKDELKQQAWRKLKRMRSRKIGPRRVPEVVKKPRRGEPPASPESPAEPVTTPSPGADDRARWRERTRDLGPRDGSPYYADRVYAEGDVLLHKRHGMGIVESIVHDNACMVLFRTGLQVIEMGRPRDMG